MNEARKWTIEKVFEDLCNLNCGIQEHLNSLDHGRSDREVLIEVNESIGKLLDGPGTLWGFDSRPVRFDDGGVPALPLPSGGVKKHEGCPAIIVINGDQYQCHMETAEGWHVGKMHCTRVETSPGFMDGFEWGIDEQGNVFFNMNASVALRVLGPQTISQAVSHIKAMAKDLSTMAYEAGKCDGRQIAEDDIPENDIPF